MCVPPEIVDIFSKREATFEKEFGELKVGEIPDTDLSLSPLILASQFMNPLNVGVQFALCGLVVFYAFHFCRLARSDRRGSISGWRFKNRDA